MLISDIVEVIDSLILSRQLEVAIYSEYSRG